MKNEEMSKELGELVKWYDDQIDALDAEYQVKFNKILEKYVSHHVRYVGAVVDQSDLRE